MKRSLLIVFLVLLADQCSKFLVKTSMYLGEEIPLLGDWFIINFTENNGMAFGLQFAGDNGKLFLTIFRILAATGICYYLYTLVKAKSHKGLITSFSLILAGALGNIIDSGFYGMLFSCTGNFQGMEQVCNYGEVATLFPAEGGYAPFLFGNVVDMLYFPLIEGYFPDWFPIWGSERFIFFRPVFNIADSSITSGVVLIIIFQKKFFKSPDENDKDDTEQGASGEGESGEPQETDQVDESSEIENDQAAQTS